MYLFRHYTRNMFKERGLEYPFVRCGRFPFPLQYYMEDKHEQNRFKRCIVCGKQVSREKYRKGLVHDRKKRWDGKERCVLFSDTLMAKVQHDFPTYDPANRALPLSVCLTCQNRKLSRTANAKEGADIDPSDAFFRPKFLNPISDHDGAQYERLLNSPHCGEGDENQHPNCVLCTSTKLGPQAKRNNGTPPCDAPSKPPQDLPRVKRQFIPQMFDCMRQIPACLEGLDFVISRTMSRVWHPEWREAFKKLSLAFDTFEPLYRNCVPASEKDPRCLLTPKLRCLLVYVEKWIEETGETLIGVSEGAFETFHQDYRLFEINFKVLRPPPGKDEADSGTTSTSPYTPSCGTRLGTQRKRKAAEDKAAELAKKRKLIIDDLLDGVDTTATKSKVNESHKSYVKRQRVFSVAAHSAWHLYKYSDRLEQAAHFSSSRKRDRPWNKTSFLTSSQASS